MIQIHRYSLLKIKFLLELSHTGNLANMDGQKAAFYRLLKEHVDGLLKDSKRCVFAIQQEKYTYSWIRWDYIHIFISTCSACVLRAPPQKPPAGKPIISLGFLTRVQIDLILIDMSSRHDGEYRWILHMRDHYSKFSYTHPLTSKRASEVASKVMQTFCLFGAPKILQSDNGREFVAAVIEDPNHGLG